MARYFNDVSEEGPRESVPLEQSEPAPQKKGYFSHLSEEPSRTRSLLSAFPKGLMKGAESLGNLHNPLASIFGNRENSLERQALEQALPTQQGHSEEELLGTAGELTPSVLFGPGGMGLKVGQIAAGTAGKHLLKQMGAPEIVQDIGSAVGMVAPQGIRAVLGKKIIPSKSQEDVFNLLKSHGMSDKQIVPFIQNKKKTNILAKWTKGMINRDKVRDEGKTISESIYGSILDRGDKLSPLKGTKKSAFVKTFNSTLDDIPYNFRKLIKEDIDVLNSSPMGWRNLREFEGAINQKIGNLEGGKAILGKMKSPINMGERMLSQDLFNEKKIMNKAYSSHKNLLKNLKSGDVEKLLNKGEIGMLVLGLITGNPLLLKGMAIKKGAEFAVSRFLVSPRFQGIQRKLIEGVKKNNEGTVLNLTTKILEDLENYISHDKKNESEQNIDQHQQ